MKTFYDLPAEIRNQIYHEALACGKLYNLRTPISAYDSCEGLLFASKQIHEEALAIWRAGNEFLVFTTPDHTPKQHPLQLLLNRPLAGFQHIESIELAFANRREWLVGVQVNGSSCLIKLFPPPSTARTRGREEVKALNKLLERDIYVEAKYMAEALARALGRALCFKAD